MAERRVAQYKVDRVARTVTVDGATTYLVTAPEDSVYRVLRGEKRVGSFEIEARDGGTYDAFVSVESDEDDGAIRSVVRAALRGKLVP